MVTALIVLKNVVPGCTGILVVEEFARHRPRGLGLLEDPNCTKGFGQEPPIGRSKECRLTLNKGAALLVVSI